MKSGWTEARDATLIRMWNEDASLREIAAQLQVSHMVVKKRAARLQLPQKERNGKAAPSSSEMMNSRFKQPAHLEAHKKARRGFEVPREKEAEYIRLLKTGIPISEVRQKLGL